jgi:hypothetical protein
MCQEIRPASCAVARVGTAGGWAMATMCIGGAWVSLNVGSRPECTGLEENGTAAARPGGADIGVSLWLS